jgi:hypothetical protein
MAGAPDVLRGVDRRIISLGDGHALLRSLQSAAQNCETSREKFSDRDNAKRNVMFDFVFAQRRRSSNCAEKV